MIARSKKRSLWDQSDERLLLKLWGQRSTDLRHAKRNAHIYMDISMKMNSKYSAGEVHTKIRNLTQKYREEKKKTDADGSLSTWRHFGSVHHIIGSNDCNSREILESFDSVLCVESHPLIDPSPKSETQSLLSPALSADISTSLSPIDNSSNASASSKRKINHFGEVVKILNEQNTILKKCIEDKTLSNAIVDGIHEQNETCKEFNRLMKMLIDKM